MAAIAGVSLQTVLLFCLIIATQVLGGALLPRTEGFHNLAWTAACLGTYGFSLWLMAFLINRGVPLSLLLPLMAALVPLALVGVGVAVYHEPASWGKIAWLLAACGAIGVASTMK